jgi:hypothetical protein
LSQINTNKSTPKKNNSKFLKRKIMASIMYKRKEKAMEGDGQGGAGQWICANTRLDVCPGDRQKEA